ncbi:unnamed protein product [Mytilus coruscus]|uniref:Farnesoic acid O-methyl transferase domain-containing protein n=1 Tax=Mytilus coruscus TaxID=42192 RepID=A0A6J8DWK9_MYTCO|nr:unnamed protein product [Mytilus coruscus]
MNTFVVLFSLLRLISSAVPTYGGCQVPRIETPNLYKYILLSNNGIAIGNPVTDSIKFKVKAKNDAHVALMSSNTDQDPLYVILLGGWANSKSVIRDRKQGTVEFDLFEALLHIIQLNKDTEQSEHSLINIEISASTLTTMELALAQNRWMKLT